MDLKKFLLGGFLAGLAIFVISMALGQIIPLIFPYNVLTLAGMRAVTDPVMMLFFLHPFVLGFALSYVYPYFAEGMGKRPACCGPGVKFGLLMWLVVSLPSAFLVVE